MALGTAYWHLARLGLSADQTSLIHGAAITVGFAAVQIALIRGARVIATAGDTYAQKLRELGAVVTPTAPAWCNESRPSATLPSTWSLTPRPPTASCPTSSPSPTATPNASSPSLTSKQHNSSASAKASTRTPRHEVSLVERWFAELTNKWLRRGTHRSIREPEAAIRTWIDNWNEDPKPFVWHKSADEILDTLAVYCERISDLGH